MRLFLGTYKYPEILLTVSVQLQWQTDPKRNAGKEVFMKVSLWLWN